MVLSMSNTNQPHLPQRITVTMKFNFNSIFYVRYKSEEISPYVKRLRCILCKSPDGVALFALLQMWKGFVAFSANIWPFSSVYQHVRLQMFRSMKRFDALDTIITPFSSMNQAVYFQSLSKAKCLIASSACVIFNHCGLTCEFSSTPPDWIFYCIHTNVRLSPTLCRHVTL